MRYLLEDELKIEKEAGEILAQRIVKWNDQICPPKKLRPAICLEDKKVPYKCCIQCVQNHVRHLAVNRLRKRGIVLRELFANNK